MKIVLLISFYMKDANSGIECVALIEPEFSINILRNTDITVSSEMK